MGLQAHEFNDDKERGLSRGRDSTMSLDPSMNSALQTLVDELESYLPSLKAKRNAIAIANDCYEAADDLCRLARHALESDTRVNYPERARGERMLLARLQEFLERKSPAEHEEYAPVLRAGAELVEIVGAVQPPPDGHLGFLRIARGLFSFLQTDFQFTEVQNEPTRIRFSSGEVYLDLNGLARDPWSSCGFGLVSENERDFWIQDLLYLNLDQRYRTLPERFELRTATEVEEWFEFIAGILKQYGTPIFENRPGVFEALAAAQAERDAAFSREMELKYGVQKDSGNVKQFDQLMSRIETDEAGRNFTRDEMNEL